MAPRSWYPPLGDVDGQIRLVRLQPRLGLKDIACQVIIANINDGPIYEALSYEWKSSKSSLKSLQVNGESIPVQENLWSALWHLGYELETRLLWIDALCIDQTDTLERNAQVQQIGRVYNQAFRVVCWIGNLDVPPHTSLPSSPSMELENPMMGQTTIANGSNGIERIRECTSAALSHLQRMTRGAADGAAALSSLRGLEAASPVWYGLEYICQRRYWRRLWAVTEVLMAYDIIIQCGDMSFSWKSLDQLLILARSTYISESENSNRATRLKHSLFQRLSMHRHRSLAQPEASPLSELLVQQYGPHYQCSEVRDKIFAVHAISADCCQRAIPIDYSLSLGQICKALVRHHYSHHMLHGAPAGFDIIHAFYYHLWPESLVGWSPSPFSVFDEPSYVFPDSERHAGCYPFICQNKGSITWISGIINLSRSTRIFQMQPMDRPRPIFNMEVRACIEAFLLWQKSQNAPKEQAKPPRSTHALVEKSVEIQTYPAVRKGSARTPSAPRINTDVRSTKEAASVSMTSGSRSPLSPTITSPGGTLRTSSFKNFFSRNRSMNKEDEEADEALWHEWLQLMDQKEATKKGEPTQRLLLTDRGTITLCPDEAQIGDRVWDFTPQWDGILITRGDKSLKVVGLTHLAFDEIPCVSSKESTRMHVNQSTLGAMARYLIR